jgi:hypothetical protein
MTSKGTAIGPLDEFWDFVKDFQNLYAKIAKLAVAAPLLDLVLNIGPPWPSRSSVTTSVVLMQILVLMCSFAIWRQGKEKLHHIKAWLVGSSVVFGVLFLLVYIPLFSFFIEDAPNIWNRLVRGYELQEPIQEFVKRMAKERGEVWGPKTLIAYFMDATHDETTIWTPGSVYTMRAITISVWLALSATYAIAVAAFVSLQYRRLK